jgi:hypothetical protein
VGKIEGLEVNAGDVADGRTARELQQPSLIPSYMSDHPVARMKPTRQLF